MFVSVSPKNASDLSVDLKKAAASGADGIEILVNEYGKLQDFPEDLKSSADIVKKFPVLLTIWNTGCDEKVDDGAAEELIKKCVLDQTVDIVSLEVVRADLVARIQAIVDNTKVKLMLSYRDYAGIKGPGQAVETALKIQDMGADLIRLIYLAKDDVDVIHAARAARQLSKSEKTTAPFCISAVGEVGLILRLYGERVGNAFGCYRLEGDTPGNLSENLEEYREIRRIYDVDHPKLQSPVAYKLGNVVMGGEKYLNCMMIKEGSRIAVLEKAYEVLKYRPDIVEWRLDYMNPMLDTDFSEKMLVETARQLYDVLGEIPILMTFRIKEQGGLKKFSRNLRLRMVRSCIQSGVISIADVEIDSDEEYIEAIREDCEKYGTKLLLSFHDWNQVPADEFMIREVQLALAKGADIPKMYLTANSYQDVIRIARTAKSLRMDGICEKPFCLCGMNDIAMITRILGGQCGSEMGYFTWSDVRGGYEEDAVYFKELLELFALEGISGY